MGQINDLIDPATLTADGLVALGCEPSGVRGASKLFDPLEVAKALEGYAACIRQAIDKLRA